MSEAYYWKPDGWYMNCEILKRWMSGEDYQWTSPSLSTFYTSRDRVKNKIAALGGCTPESMFLEGKAHVAEVNLPDELEGGELILGNIVIRNTGDIKDILRCRAVTEWNGVEYGACGLVSIGSRIDIYFTENTGVVMPTQDAIVTIHAQHYHTPTLSWVTDDVKTH